MATTSQTPVNQLFLALFSLFLAFSVWVIVRQQEVVIQTVLVPVVVSSPPPYIELSPEIPFDPPSIPVTFSFPKGDERLATSSDFRLIIDASELAERVSSTETYTRHSLVASRDNLRFPSALTFVEFADAPEIIFRARLRTAQVVVQPQVVDGRPESGYRVLVDEVTVDPDTLTIAVDEARQILSREGPLSILTEAVDPTGQRNSIRRIVGVLFDSEAGLYPMPDRPSPTVQVNVPITEIEETRVYEGIPIRFGTIRRNREAVLSPLSADVTVFGPVGLLNRLDPQMIRVSPLPNEFIDEEAVGEPFTTSLEVTFDTPDAAFGQLRAETEPTIVRIQFYERQIPPGALEITEETPALPAPREEEHDLPDASEEEPDAIEEEEEILFIPDPEEIVIEASPEASLSDEDDLLDPSGEPTLSDLADEPESEGPSEAPTEEAVDDPSVIEALDDEHESPFVPEPAPDLADEAGDLIESTDEDDGDDSEPTENP